MCRGRLTSPQSETSIDDNVTSSKNLARPRFVAELARARNRSSRSPSALAAAAKRNGADQADDVVAADGARQTAEAGPILRYKRLAGLSR